MSAELQNLLLEEKFASQVWTDRGLIPSSKSLCDSLQNEFNSIIKEILKVPSGYSDLHMVFLQNSIKNFDKYDLDSEEKELVVDYFFEISRLMNIDINESLSFWLYGFDPDEIPKIKPLSILETIKNSCTSCKASLKVEIFKKRRNVPALWLIVQCNNCDELNLLSIPAEIDRFKSHNFFVLELLKQNEYTLEEVNRKLEFFRKNIAD